MPLQIHTLEIDSALEAQAIRATAECLGATVGVTWVANSRQIVEFFSQEPCHDLIFICGHGDERGILLPALADDVRPHFPFCDVLTPANLASFIRLDGCTVLSSCCATGTNEMAAAFLENGARCFIAPTGFPEGDAALLLCLHFLFAYSKTDAKQAFESANVLLQSADQFHFFE